MIASMITVHAHRYYIIMSIVIIIPYPDNISNYKNGVCLICLLHILQFIFIMAARLKTGVYMRLEIPLEYFCHLYSRLLSFRGRFFFTCLVSSFRSLSLLCFGQRKKVGTTSSLSALFFEEKFM